MEEELQNAKLAIKKAITQSPLSFTYLNEDARNDEEIAKHALKSIENLFEKCRRLPNGDFDFQRINQYYQMYDSLISFIGPVLKNDKSFTIWTATDLNYLKDDIFERWYGPWNNPLNDDEDVMLALVKRDWELFDYASERLKDHPNFLKKILKVLPWSLVDQISDRLKDDEEFLRSAFADCSCPINGLINSSERLKDKDDFVFWAISETSKEELYCIISECQWEWEEFVSDRLLNDRNFILRCVEANPHVLFLLPARFLDDESIVFAGLRARQNLIVDFDRISSRLKQDKAFVLRSPVLSASALKYGDPTLKEDSEVVLKAMSFSGTMLSIVHPRLKADKNIVLVAMQESPLAFKYVGDEFNANVQIVELGLRHDRSDTNWPQQQDWNQYFQSINKKLCILSDNLLENGDDTLKSLLEDQYLSQHRSESNKLARAERDIQGTLSRQWERFWIAGQLNFDPTSGASSRSLSTDDQSTTSSTIDKIKNYPGNHRSIAEFAGYKKNITELKAYGPIIKRMVKFDLALHRPSTGPPLKKLKP